MGFAHTNQRLTGSGWFGTIAVNGVAQSWLAREKSGHED
jgi:hypothetical protein